jgi:4-hydroxy-L-threonine phosphate dehydrogenase PdxA
LRSLRDLTQHLTTRADDNHAPPVSLASEEEDTSLHLSRGCQALVRFFALLRIKPHAGENGLFGWEEEKEIAPAIAEAKQNGLNVEGPVAPDTLFSKAKGGQYDIAVAMYHDQGHIPLKVTGFVWNEGKNKWESVSGVNITLGLPIIRVSVDHGTAFGKAGKGTANHESLMNAIEYGAKLAKRRIDKNN